MEELFSNKNQKEAYALKKIVWQPAKRSPHWEGKWEKEALQEWERERKD